MLTASLFLLNPMAEFALTLMEHFSVLEVLDRAIINHPVLEDVLIYFLITSFYQMSCNLIQVNPTKYRSLIDLSAE